MTTSQRAIIHVDMDAFYASIEQLDDPSLVGQPVIVGGTGPRGVVAAASYEARAFGVHSAMPVSEARRRCPEGHYQPVRMTRYKSVSEKIFACFHEITPVVEGLSLDEAFLDVTGSIASWGEMSVIGRTLKERIRTETGLTASVGMSHNKLLAKIASKLHKPDGFCQIAADQVRQILDPLPISSLWGIGPRTLPRLKQADIYHFRDVRTAPPALLNALFGRFGEHYRKLANGEDDRPVVADAPYKSISSEETFDTDISDPDELEKRLLAMCQDITERLRKRELRASLITLKLRLGDFSTHSRSRRFEPPGNSCAIIHPIARDLLRAWLAEYPGHGLRLLGIAAGKFASDRQFDLFPAPDELENKLEDTADTIRERFGSRALQPGKLIR